MANTRVCVLTNQYPPDTGGVGNSAHRVTNYLASQGLTMHVLHFRKHPVPIPLDEAVETTHEGPVTVHRARVWHPDWKEGLLTGGRITSEAEVLTRYNREMFDVLGRLQALHGFDLLHGFFLYPAGFVATTAARLYGVKSIASIRGNDIGKYMFDPLRAGFVEASLRNADYVTSVARSLLDTADRAMHPVADKSRVILNSLDRGTVVSGSRPNLDLRGAVIGTTGLIRYKKGLIYLFKALAELRERFEFTLLLTGDFFNEEEKRIHEKALQDLGLLDRTIITGRLSRKEMFDHLPLYDVLVYPSLFAEGCPLSMLEGMAMGRTIVASNTGAIPEMIADDDSGVLVEPGDPAAIARALERLLRSPEESRRLGDGALRRSAELSSERELDAWLDVYRHVLASNPQGDSSAESGKEEEGANIASMA